MSAVTRWLSRRLAKAQAPYPGASPVPAEGQHPKDPTVALRWFLGGHGPGWWASDHAEESRHATGWNYVAVHACAKAAAAAEVHAYRELPPGAASGLVAKAATSPDSDRPGRRPLPADHPLARLLARPNPFQPAPVFFYALELQLRLTGSALVWAVLNDLGGASYPVELWSVPTALAQPQPPSGNYPMGAYWVSALATTGYVAETGWGASTPWAGGLLVDARYVRRIHWPHPLHLNDGLSPLSAGALEVDISEQLNRATWSSFVNEAKPGLVFTTGGSGDFVPQREQLERFQADVQAWRAGAENAGRHMVLPPGVELANPNRSPAELDYVGGRNQSRDNVLALQHTPPIAAGVTEAGSYAQFYVAMMQWCETSIQPDLSLIAAELTHFLGPYFGDDVRLEMVARRFDDQQMLDARLAADTAGGYLLKNEARALRGLPPLPDLAGQYCGAAPAVPAAAAAAPPPAAGERGPGLARPERRGMPRPGASETTAV